MGHKKTFKKRQASYGEKKLKQEIILKMLEVHKYMKQPEEIVREARMHWEFISDSTSLLSHLCSDSAQVGAEASYKKLSVCETLTIKQLADIIRKDGLCEKLSDKEFDEFILSRRPMELLLIANMIVS